MMLTEAVLTQYACSQHASNGMVHHFEPVQVRKAEQQHVKESTCRNITIDARTALVGLNTAAVEQSTLYRFFFGYSGGQRA